MAIGLFWLGSTAVARTLAYAVLGTSVDQAHALAPGDARILSAMAATGLDTESSDSHRRRADDLARGALLRDATSVPALVTLGVNAQLRGDVALARRIFIYSHAISRRDLGTNLWRIEDAVGSSDINLALRNYDIALRTSRDASDVLFPVLGDAIDDPLVRASVVRTLARRPLWTEAFIGFVAKSGTNPHAAAALLMASWRAGVPVADWMHATIIGRLIEGGDLRASWLYYAGVHPGADRRRSRDPNFVATVEYPSAFDWVPLAGDGVSASFQRGERGGLFDFALPAGAGGPVLRQMQMLPPGRYGIEGSSTGIKQPTTALPYWSLSCVGGGEISRVAVSPSTHSGGRFEGAFTVPNACPVQQLTLLVNATGLPEGVTGQIERAIVHPVP